MPGRTDGAGDRVLPRHREACCTQQGGTAGRPGGGLPQNFATQEARRPETGPGFGRQAGGLLMEVRAG